MPCRDELTHSRLFVSPHIPSSQGSTKEFNTGLAACCNAASWVEAVGIKPTGGTSLGFPSRESAAPIEERLTPETSADNFHRFL
jgi:hypothetical protein